MQFYLFPGDKLKQLKNEIVLRLCEACSICVHASFWLSLLSIVVSGHFLVFILWLVLLTYFRQCFDAVGWRQEGHPACKKLERCGAGMVICLERGADLHMAQLMPLSLTVSCFSKIQIGFTFLVLVHLGTPGKGPLNGCLLGVVDIVSSCTCLAHFAVALILICS